MLDHTDLALVSNSWEGDISVTSCSPLLLGILKKQDFLFIGK